MNDYKGSIHFKEQWIFLNTHEVQNTEYSTETVYASSQGELDNKVQALIDERYGSAIVGNVRHVVEVLGVDGSTATYKRKLTKEEMFDFILDNGCDITYSNQIWTTTSGEKVRVKYNVSINEARLFGMDLEEAIQYYYDNLRKR